MAAVQKEITVVPRRAPLKLKWFDGSNAVEVAEWLVAHGTRATVEFHQFGQNLKVDGYAKEVDRHADIPGEWMDEDGELYSVKQIDEEYEVIKR